MRNKAGFDTPTVLSNLHVEKDDYIVKMEITTQKKGLWNLPKEQAEQRIPVIEWMYGECLRINLRSFPQLQSQMKTLDTLPIITLKFNPNISWKKALILLHSVDDLPDAYLLQTNIFVPMDEAKNYRYRVEKRILPVVFFFDK